MAEEVDVVPGEEERIVDPDDFVPSGLLVDVKRQDGGSGHCGQWYFYSSVCGHVLSNI